MDHTRRRRLITRSRVCNVVAALAALYVGAAAPAQTTYQVIGYNDLGMHCMQPDFSQMMILPPYNNLHAQVIRRGSEPSIVQNATIEYRLLDNTRSADKTNFWRYAMPLMGANLAPDVGLTGHGLAGPMSYNTSRHDFEATGIPVTPIDDSGRENPYPIVTITAKVGGQVVAQTQAVVPVSWEMSCNLCHNTPGVSMATDILRAHDRLHATDLEQHQPVFCAGCHSDNALGTPGLPDVPSLSSAMHGAHATRMDQANLTNSCYACHPGIRTQCLRDVHAANNITCVDCHGDMAAVANPARNPWLQEPTCGSCHTRQGFEFEQPGVLFRNSVGHGGVQCMTCHNSPHTVTPAVTEADNLQSMRLQGHTGKINTCTVCHTSQPGDPFPHRRND